MTEQEMIRKLTEKTLMLEEESKQIYKIKEEYKKMYYERVDALENAEMRCTDFARKLKAIEDEVNNYQFDSVTNLQNKIKTILMSNDSKDEENAKH